MCFIEHLSAQSTEDSHRFIRVPYSLQCVGWEGVVNCMQAALCAACEALGQRLGPAAGELADGGALAAATSLVWEEAVWLKLALQVCTLLFPCPAMFNNLLIAS